MVLRPGFEPGSVAFSLEGREATILNRTILPEPKLVYFLLAFPVYSHFVFLTITNIFKAASINFVSSSSVSAVVTRNAC
jgi:hypothetical protein